MKKNTSKITTVRCAITAAVSIICSIISIVQNALLKNDGAFYVAISSKSIFDVLALALMALSLVLLLISHITGRSQTPPDSETLYTRHKAANKFLLIMILIYIPLFVISVVTLQGTDITAFSKLMVLIGISISLFIGCNAVLYIVHRRAIREYKEKGGLLVWSQIFFFFTNSALVYVYIGDVYDLFDTWQEFVIGSMLYIGIIGLIVCMIIGIVRRRRVKTQASQDYTSVPMLGSEDTWRAVFIFLLCACVVFAIASVFMPLNTAAEVRQYTHLFN